MKRTDIADPWRAPVIVGQIPETGLRRELEANPSTRAALAEIAGVREVVAARAVFDLMPESEGKVHVRGNLSARIGQTCVVTLDPIENAIDETIDLIFAPPDQLAALVAPDDEDHEDAGDATDQLEPIENGVIDLGRLATDVLFLAIDPYPRKAGAVFEPQIAATDPEDHPFAALKALKVDPAEPGPTKKK
jgi:uncharacterized metal-binding protein YceD (DUF177 family)